MVWHYGHFYDWRIRLIEPQSVIPRISDLSGLEYRSVVHCITPINRCIGITTHLICHFNKITGLIFKVFNFWARRDRISKSHMPSTLLFCRRHFLLPESDCFDYRWTPIQSFNPCLEVWILFLQSTQQPRRNWLQTFNRPVPWNKGEVSKSALISNQELLVLQCAIQDLGNSLDFLNVALLGTRQLFMVVIREPLNRTLAV